MILLSFEMHQKVMWTHMLDYELNILKDRDSDQAITNDDNNN